MMIQHHLLLTYLVVFVRGEAEPAAPPRTGSGPAPGGEESMYVYTVKKMEVLADRFVLALALEVIGLEVWEVHACCGS
jgi:hypothetical protein